MLPIKRNSFKLFFPLLIYKMLELLLWEDIKAWTRPTVPSLVIKSSKTVKRPYTKLHKSIQVLNPSRLSLQEKSLKLPRTRFILTKVPLVSQNLCQGEACDPHSLPNPGEGLWHLFPASSKNLIGIRWLFPFLFFFSFPAGARPVLQARNSWQVYRDVFLAGRADAVPSVCIKDSFPFYFFPSKWSSVQQLFQGGDGTVASAFLLFVRNCSR